MNDLQEEFSEFGPSQHIHAIGMIVLHFSLLESWLQDLMVRYLPALPSAAVYSIFKTLNNRQRLDLLRALSAQEADEQSTELVGTILRSYDVCAENRNLVAHAWPTFQHQETDKEIYMLKQPNRDPSSLEGYDFTLDDLQQAARAIWQCGELLNDVILVPLGKPLASSGKLQTPRKLSLRQRPKAPQSDQAQPQSSPE